MKAHINGITIEGTPEEIAKYQRLQQEQSRMKPYKWPTDARDGQIPLMPVITSGTTKKCNFPCYCTGACQGISGVAKSLSILDQQYTKANGGYYG